MRLKLPLIAALAIAAGFAMPAAVSVSTAQATTVDLVAMDLECQQNVTPGFFGVPMGESTTCTADVTDSEIGATTPTGPIFFTVADTQGTITIITFLGSCTLAADNLVLPPDEQADCSFSYIPEQFGTGTQILTATYNGDSLHAGGSTYQDVEQLPRASSTVLTCSPAAVFSGQATSCTASVTDLGSFDVTTPTGTVSFISGTHKGNFTAVGSCTLAAVVVGQAACTLTYTPPAQLPLGTQQVAATYFGDSEFSPSGAQIAITVTPGLAALYQSVTTPTPVGPGNSLGSIVQRAQADYAAGDVAATCGTLGAFVNEVAALTGKIIPATTAVQLTAVAQQIQADLAC
jgi:hypothetical protein